MPCGCGQDAGDKKPADKKPVDKKPVEKKDKKAEVAAPKDKKA